MVPDGRLPGGPAEAARPPLTPAAPRGNPRTYAVLQFAGWTAYALLGLVITRQFQALTPRYAATIVFGCGLAALFTHALRALAHARGWFALPLPALVLRFVPAALVAAALEVAIVLVAGVWGFRAYRWQGTTAAILLAAYFNWSFAYLLWLAFYTTAVAFRRYRWAEIRRLQLEVSTRDA